MTHVPHRTWLRALVISAIAVALGACQSRPEVRTQSAPAVDVLRYQTFGFVEHPDTDKSGYTTLTTRYLKDAVTREMLARGYTTSESPDLVINFVAATRDKVEGTTGPAVGVGYGRWGWHGWGWSVGYGGQDVRTITEGSLTIDLVDRRRNELVWSGTAEGRLTKKAMRDPQPAIEQAVAAIFAKYPKAPLVANAEASRH